jgi:hypothetical protein
MSGLARGEIEGIYIMLAGYWACNCVTVSLCDYKSLAANNDDRIPRFPKNQ